MNVISNTVVSEEILLCMTNKDLSSAEASFQRWSDIINSPCFLWKKCRAEGMSTEELQTWKRFLSRANFNQGCIKLLRKALLHKEEHGNFPSVLFMILVQEEIQDIKSKLEFVEIDLPLLRSEFKFLSEFENYNMPELEPVVRGIEVEIHSNLRMEFATLMNGRTELWSRQMLFRDNTNKPILKVWNTTPTLLMASDSSEVVALQLEKFEE